MRLALVHDHLAQLGGAEKTLKALTEIFPQSPLFTLLYRLEYAARFFDTTDIRASFLQRLPWGVSRYQWYVPLMPAAIESFDLQDYDAVISSASSFAKGVISAPHATHICYCHTPTRYLWHYNNQYVDELALPAPLKNLISLYLSRLRQWDASAAHRVDYFIANSHTTRDRIRKYYQRDSVVIHPPVDTHFFSISDTVEDYFVTGGRLTPYKRFDIAIQACNKLQLPLYIFGSGPDRRRLQKLAGPTIYFLGAISDTDKARVLMRARAFLNPQEEDFGITQVEALASGRPVIAYDKGGAREIVRHGENGILVAEQTWEAFADAIVRFIHTDAFHFFPHHIKASAERFSVQRFKRELGDYVDHVLNHNAALW